MYAGEGRYGTRNYVPMPPGDPPSSVSSLESGGNSGATLEILRAISAISSPRPAAYMSRARAWAVNIAERSR